MSPSARGSRRSTSSPTTRRSGTTTPTKIGLEFVSRIPKPPLEDVLRSSIGIPTEGYLHQLYFSYPIEGGFEAIVDAFAARCAGKLRTGWRVARVERDGAGWRVASDSGEEIRCDTLVSTIPIHELLKVWPGAPDAARAAAARLRYNSLINVVIGSAEPPAHGYTAVYVPDPEILFHRVSFPHAFSERCAPEGSSIAMAEITANDGDGVWEMSDEALLARVTEDLDAHGLGQSRARSSYRRVVRFQYGYPVYDLEYRHNVTSCATRWRRPGCASSAGSRSSTTSTPTSASSGRWRWPRSCACDAGSGALRLLRGRQLGAPAPLGRSQGASILDVGCGRATTSERLHRLGNRVTGIESSPEAVAKARRAARRGRRGRSPRPRGNRGTSRGTDLRRGDLRRRARALDWPGPVLQELPALREAGRHGDHLAAQRRAAGPRASGSSAVGSSTPTRGVLDRTHLRFFTKKSARRLIEDAGLASRATPTRGDRTGRGALRPKKLMAPRASARRRRSAIRPRLLESTPYRALRQDRLSGRELRRQPLARAARVSNDLRGPHPAAMKLTVSMITLNEERAIAQGRRRHPPRGA